MKMRRATEADITAVEQVYGITLTSEELMLLLTSRDLLSPLEQQRAYLLAMALTAIPCPACGLVTCQRAAAVTGWMDAADDDYACHACHMPLTWVLPFTGQSFFVVNLKRQHMQAEIAAQRAAAEPPCPACQGKGGFEATGERCSDCLGSGIDPAAQAKDRP